MWKARRSNMNIIILFFSLALSVAVAAAAVTINPKEDEILVLEFKIDEADQTFHSRYETSSGTKVEQNGHLKYVTPDATGNSVEGRYSYIGDDGQEYKVSYTAGEFGYQPSGRHIPAVPEAIKRSLKYIAEHPYVEPVKRASIKR